MDLLPTRKAIEDNNRRANAPSSLGAMSEQYSPCRAAASIQMLPVLVARRRSSEADKQQIIAEAQAQARPCRTQLQPPASIRTLGIRFWLYGAIAMISRPSGA